MTRQQGRHDVCRGKTCGRSIVWLKTTHDRWMPVDPTNVVPDDTHFDSLRHTSHYATCPDAKDFKRGRKS